MTVPKKAHSRFRHYTCRACGKEYVVGDDWHSRGGSYMCQNCWFGPDWDSDNKDIQYDIVDER